MARLHETKLPRYKIANRRGVWTTWSAPQTWSVCLVRADNLRASLKASDCLCNAVDVTDRVLQGSCEPLEPHSTLLLLSPHQPWATLVERGGYNERHDQLEQSFPGEVLRTGFSRGNGVVYVWHSVRGKRTLDFRTDGLGWPAPPEDAAFVEEDEELGCVFIFESDRYRDDWPQSFSRVEEAHQQLIIDLNAYIPMLTFSDTLGAEYGHDDACRPEHIEQVLWVEFAS